MLSKHPISKITLVVMALISALPILLVLPPIVIAQDSSWAGQKVVTKYQCPVTVEDRVVDDDSEFRIYEVTRVEGDRLWVKSGSIEGTLAVSEVVRFDQAINFFTQEIEADPADSAAWARRGNIWQNKKEYDKAIADFTEAIRLDPENGIPFCNRGNAWSGKKEYEKAIADYNEAIRLDPKCALNYYIRGNAWCDEKEYDKAIVDFNEAIRLEPKDARFYSDRGDAWINKEEYDKAIADLTEAIRLDPRAFDAYLNRGRAWGYKDQNDKAIADFNEAISLDPRESLAYVNRGLAWGFKREYEKAIADYNEAIRLDPKAFHAYVNRGRIWGYKEQYDKAIADFNEAIKLDPGDSKAYVNRGVAWGFKREYEKAIADYNEAIRLDPKIADAYDNLAWLLATCPDARRRDGKKAVESATRACELREWKEAYPIATLAAAYAEVGNFDKAVEWQEKANRISRALRIRRMVRSDSSCIWTKNPIGTLNETIPSRRRFGRSLSVLQRKKFVDNSRDRIRSMFMIRSRSRLGITSSELERIKSKAAMCQQIIEGHRQDSPLLVSDLDRKDAEPTIGPGIER